MLLQWRADFHAFRPIFLADAVIVTVFVAVSSRKLFVVRLGPGMSVAIGAVMTGITPMLRPTFRLTVRLLKSTMTMTVPARRLWFLADAIDTPGR